MYLAFNPPHDPRQSPKEFVDQYPVDKVKLPENFLPEYPFKDKIGCGKKDQSYGAIFGAYMNLQRMVVEDGWKLIYYPGCGKYLLFDLANDPLEQNDLSEDARHRQRLDRRRREGGSLGQRPLLPRRHPAL